MRPWPEIVPRLVATDIDGTIVPHGGTVSERTRSVLQTYTERGVGVVMVTGRPPRWLPPVVEATGLAGPIIAANGAVVVDAHSLEPTEVNPIAPEHVVEAVARFAAMLPDALFAVETPEELRIGPGFERIRKAAPREGLVPQEPPVTQAASVEELVDGEDLIKIMVLSPASDPNQLLAAGRAEASDIVSVTRSSLTRPLLELGPQGVTKASTLARLAGARDITAAETVAFGDMPNDVEMLRWAGHGFAMDGGHHEVLEAAPYVAPPAAQDGVAQVLETFLERRPVHG